MSHKYTNPDRNDLFIHLTSLLLTFITAVQCTLFIRQVETLMAACEFYLFCLYLTVALNKEIL